MKRWLRRGLAGGAALAAVAAGGGYHAIRTSLPQISGEIAVDGPSRPVEIIRDRNAIPYIRAGSLADAYYGLGFVHAQDRLFQMDVMRRLGAGRLSEIVGARTVATDRAMRTLGLYRLARASLALLAPETRDALDAYAAGVNSYLATHAGVPAPEFLALDYRPEPWAAADSLVWGRLMAMRLAGNWRTEALRARLAGRLTPAQIDDLWPRPAGDAPPTVATAPAAAGGGAAPVPRLLAAMIEAWPETLRRVSASNSWALSGRHTASGLPLLANDPHLGFRAPGQWYLAQIRTPRHRIVGATVPGVPFTILGHNGGIAWGFTSTGSDTQDLFVERLDPADADRYLTPDGPLPFTVRSETIGVRDAADVTIRIRHTRHGPVISDLYPGLATEDGHVVALAAAAFSEDDLTAQAIFRLNRARDWDQFRSALRDFHAPQQNVTYADRLGNIGFVAAGRVPIRKAGKGRVPVPGWTGAYDWQGFIPFEALPRVFNPPSGRIVNANQRVVGDDYRYHLGHGGTPGYRARRIHALLDAPGVHDAERSAAMQLDTVSLMARDLIPAMTGFTAAGARARAALARIRRWDGTMRRDRPEPLIFIAWLRELNRQLFADELGPDFAALWGLRPLSVERVLRGRPGWCDDVATAPTESCAERLETALERALAMLARRFGDDPQSWRWGDAHYADFRHPVFDAVPGLRWLANIRVASDGGAYTLNRALHRSGSEDAPFVSVHGPGYRAVYDLAALDRTRFALATGQSGNPLSPHYRDLTRGWRDGEYLRLPGSRAAALSGAAGVLRLMPRR